MILIQLRMVGIYQKSNRKMRLLLSWRTDRLWVQWACWLYFSTSRKQCQDNVHSPWAPSRICKLWRLWDNIQIINNSKNLLSFRFLSLCSVSSFVLLKKKKIKVQPCVQSLVSCGGLRWESQTWACSDLCCPVEAGCKPHGWSWTF